MRRRSKLFIRRFYRFTNPNKLFLLFFLMISFLLGGCVFVDGLSNLSSRTPQVEPDQSDTRGLQESGAQPDNVEDPQPSVVPTIPHQRLNGNRNTFGVEITQIQQSDVLLPLVKSTNFGWVRYGAFPWDLIEPIRTNPPTYNWEVVNEEFFADLSKSGASIIATIRYSPEWAQKYSGSTCGPVAEEAFFGFAQFVQALVERYSKEPYNIKYWELGNEPDVDRSLIGSRHSFGCWGESTEAYYGGEYYGTMLHTIYPAIKVIDPQAQVLIGGLLLDCDPTHPIDGQSCHSGNFFEGILKAGGGDYFDILSFHAYPQYFGSLLHDDQYPGWEHRGGIVLGKVNFLREVMYQYGVDKPIIHSEGSLLCPPDYPDYCDPQGSAFLEAQADYVVRLFIRNWANDLLGTIWYTLEGDGWRHGGMLGTAPEPKPAFKAMQFLSSELHGASFNQALDLHPFLEVYEFLREGKSVWVIWSPNEQGYKLDLPDSNFRIVNLYGEEIELSENVLLVSRPVYMEFLQ